MSEEKPKRTIQEEIEVAGNEAVSRVKEIIAEGNVRRLVVRKPDGGLIVEIPLTAGVLAGGAMIAFAPALAVLGTVAALIAKVHIEIIREVNDDDEVESTATRVEVSKKKVEIPIEDDEKPAVKKAKGSVDRAEDAARKLTMDIEEEE